MSALADLIAGAVSVPVRSGEGGAEVARLTLADGRDAYLKSGSGLAAVDVAAEIERLRWLQGRISCPAMIADGGDGDKAWLLSEAVSGQVAGDRLRDDPGSLSRVMAGLAGYVHDLHTLPVAECPFDASVAGWLPIARQRIASGLVDEEDFDDDHADWTAAAVLAEVEALAAYAAGQVVVHGDLTLGNVLVDAAGRVTGCVDVGRLGVGDPYQDIALLWRDLGGFGREAQAELLAALGIGELDEQRLRLHRSLDELF